MKDLAQTVLTLALGAWGGFCATWLQIPLPWLIGAMVATTAASMSGLRLRVHTWVRDPSRAVLGVLLGSSFAPSVFSRFGEWLLPIAGLVVYITIVTALLFWYFRRVARLDGVAAFCSASPGGVAEMTIVGRELGGDDRLIALVQSSRALLVILTIPLGFALVEDYRVGERPPAGGALLDLSLREALILAGCAIAGTIAARAIRMPAASVTGPLLLSAGAHLLGLSEAGPPAILIILTQIAIGAYVGARFAGVSLSTVARMLALSVGALVVVIGLTVVFALIIHGVADTSIQAVVLAYAPGGLAEMSVVALAMALDPAFVATHHLIRVILVVVVAPTLLRRFVRQKQRKRTKAAIP